VFRSSVLLAAVVVTSITATPAFGDDDLSSPRYGAEQIEYFELFVRPVLVEHCYPCHNSTETAESGLAVDYRDGLLRGGDGGPAVVPGDPGNSRLLATMRHQIDGLEMPAGGPELEPAVIARIETWIADGAADPRDRPPSAEEFAATNSWEAILGRRKEWWSFQPIVQPETPIVDSPEWSRNPIDRFVYRKMIDNGLQPAAVASADALVRRLFINLIGLPPSADEAEQWTARLVAAGDQQRDQVIGELADHLLDSPRFGERWARHWMDWIRYAESHGSEGDPEIAQAWIYRDYLIRAINDDVPLDQLIREHIAGDQLSDPRIDAESGWNESMIGPTHWRMVFHGFAPTDPLDEKVRFIDDQINTFSKAFLGLTVSCARCHDHKFDAISQQDYYALFGILGSCRPGRNIVDVDQLGASSQSLSDLKTQLRGALVADWMAQLDQVKQRIAEQVANQSDANAVPAILRPIAAVVSGVKETADGAPENNVRDRWNRERDAYTSQHADWRAASQRDAIARWEFGDRTAAGDWFTHPQTLGGFDTETEGSRLSAAAGEFAVATEGQQAVLGIYPAGVYSHLLSTKHPARFASPDWPVAQESELWVESIGGGESSQRYVVQDFPRDGTVYPVTRLTAPWRWQKYDIDYWAGDSMHFEFATALDAPLLVRDQPRSWFGVRRVIVQPKGNPPPSGFDESLAPIFLAADSQNCDSVDEILQVYLDAIRSAIDAWSDASMTDQQALLLDACLQSGLLTNELAALPTAGSLIHQYRQVEATVPVLTRVPGLDETVARDQPLFIRGNHKLPSDLVPRRFLEAIDPLPYETTDSGRLRLAEDVLRDDNPLTRRVIANRIWHHLFGTGIVRTPDNFGRLGGTPSHPELLDFLALQLSRENWSLRKFVRAVVTSRSWRASSEPSADARATDPENLWLSHANVRRVEAEVVRDTMVSLSGNLDLRVGGPPVGTTSPRRSVYLAVRRNELDPLLRTFDFPEPFAAVGRRDVTNVPAQSLAMMNDPLVQQWAADWAKRVMADPALVTPSDRIDHMFLSAFGRHPTEDQLRRATQFLSESRLRMEDKRSKLNALNDQLSDLQTRVEETESAIRAKVLQDRPAGQVTSTGNLPPPLLRWDFASDDAKSLQWDASNLRAGAQVAGNQLVVRQGGHVITAAIPKTIREKTLEAWVVLDRLDQSGGGVMTLQQPGGGRFDAVVYGEREPARWMAGSEGFARTASFGGPAETEATQRPVHIAICYHADGKIVAYRDGVPYGQAYQSEGPLEFAAGQAVVGFGIRHLPAGGNRMLDGSILKANLYDYALSANQVAQSSGCVVDFVSAAEMDSAMTTDQRERLASNRQQIERIRAERDSIGAVPTTIDDSAVMTELAAAMFTFQELIYVR
jgi:hypothetical protein